uniref:Ig-like domain-containing protein n=1 Tax=Pseudonaja textilis TaxID=8673 RepID=A0A670Z5U1_PSETE
KWGQKDFCLTAAILPAVLLPSRTASSSHSLLYFRHAVLLEGQPQFTEVTYLDGQPIQHYDSNTERMRPFPLWNEQLDDNHTLQCIEGCKLTADGEEIEIHQDAFDGKEMKGEKFHSKRAYLHGNCIQWLNRYLDMRPQRKELPIVKVTHQEVIDNLQALTCQAYGFYPKEISASWRKDGEIFNQTNSSMLIAPNSDGTFNARLSIQINPKERNLYRCHVEHVSSNDHTVTSGRGWVIRSDEKINSNSNADLVNGLTVLREIFV